MICISDNGGEETMKSKRGKTVFPGMVICLAFFAFPLLAQKPDVAQVMKDTKWQNGPCNVALGAVADLRVPIGYVYAGASDTIKLMDAMGNIPSNKELGLLAPGTFEWFVLYEFAEVGYIKDDEKNSLDADVLLKTIQRSTEEANKIRKKRGFPAMQNIAWLTKPYYDEVTHNLEWAIRGDDETGGTFVNHNTRFLGRKGMMVVTLVGDPAGITDVLPKFKDSLTGFNFKAGNTYAEFRQGDKLAGYGLTAVVAGGATAVAVKTGLFKYIGKFFVFILAAFAAFFKKVWAFLKGLFKPKERPY